MVKRLISWAMGGLMVITLLAAPACSQQEAAPMKMSGEQSTKSEKKLTSHRNVKGQRTHRPTSD